MIPGKDFQTKPVFCNMTRRSDKNRHQTFCNRRKNEFCIYQDSEKLPVYVYHV